MRDIDALVHAAGEFIAYSNNIIDIKCDHSFENTDCSVGKLSGEPAAIVARMYQMWHNAALDVVPEDIIIEDNPVFNTRMRIQILLDSGTPVGDMVFCFIDYAETVLFQAFAEIRTVRLAILHIRLPFAFPCGSQDDLGTRFFDDVSEICDHRILETDEATRRTVLGIPVIQHAVHVKEDHVPLFLLGFTHGHAPVEPKPPLRTPSAASSFVIPNGRKMPCMYFIPASSVKGWSARNLAWICPSLSE